MIKGVPTDITESEFKEFLDINKISYVKTEQLKSQKDGRVLPIFQLDIRVVYIEGDLPPCC